MSSFRSFFFFLGWSLASAVAAWGAPMGTLKPTQTLYPRTDLNVIVDGVPLEPGMGLTSWTALIALPPGKPGRASEFLALGEMVLLEEEVPGALNELKRQFFQVNTVHGPFLNSSPVLKRLYFNRRGPQGPVVEGVKALGRYLARFQPRPGKTPSPLPIHRTSPTPSPTLSPLKNPETLWIQVETVLGPGERSGKLLNYVIPSKEAVLMEGVELPANMGVATEIHFQKVEGLVVGERGPLGLGVSSKATQPVVAAAGQFALKDGEADPIWKFMREFQVTTLNEGHFTRISPDLTFLNFWVVGPPGEVAKILRETLDKIEAFPLNAPPSKRVEPLQPHPAHQAEHQ